MEPFTEDDSIVINAHFPRRQSCLGKRKSDSSLITDRSLDELA